MSHATDKKGNPVIPRLVEDWFFSYFKQGSL